jgi:Rrf2 family protein
MKLSDGVEWAVHVCAVLASLPAGKGLSGAKLAEFHDLPPAYLAKQLQALSRAGIVTAARGVKGGYRLARPPAEISLLDITLAVEGREPAFRCTEIRRQGPCATPPAACKQMCPIARAFLGAEQAWRTALASVTLADIAVQAVGEAFDAKRIKVFLTWLEDAMQ